MPLLTLFGYKIQIGITKDTKEIQDVFQEDLSESDLFIKRQREISDERFEPKEEVREPMTTKEFIRSWIPFIVVLCVLLSAFLGVRYYLTKHFGGVVVDGESMTHTLEDGEKLLMKYSSGGAKADYGDIIVVDVRNYDECGDTQFLIKRLIAKEGDKVKCEDGQVYIWKNWENNAEGYVAMNEPYAHYTSAADYDFNEYEVKKGEIFFLGDNRSYSIDSRYNEFNGSHLKTLYKAKDIYGIVPDWAITNREFIKKIFFS
jgi:signal peptidase I